jgi:hypothetical protein
MAERGQLDDLAKQAWKEHGVLPSQLMEQTPHQLFALFFKFNAAGEAADAVTLLARHNRARAGKGLPPAIPGWFWAGAKGVRRAR